MLALRKTRAAFGLDLVEAAAPAPPGPGEVIVEIEAAGICGSDVHALEWSEGYGFMVPHLPLTMGHECAGRIVAAGPGAQPGAGARVAVYPAVACGGCASCARGDARNCECKATIGITCDGGFARRLRLPAANCVALPDNVDTELGALAEPLAVGCEAVLVGEPRLGDTVLVLGPGTIGQAIALMARAAGAGRVLVAGRADAPRFAVLRDLGFTDLLDVAEAPLRDLVLDATGGRPVDVALEATGQPASIAEGMTVLRKGGVMVAVGIHAAPLSLPITDFVRMRHQLRASHGSSRATWDRVMALLGREPEAFRPMITHRLPLERGLEGFELARQRAAGKVILTP